MKRPVLSHPIPVRLRPDQRKRLESASRRFRLAPSELIRLAVDGQLAAYDRDGRIIITSTPATHD